VPIYLFNQAILKQDGTPDYIISYIQDITEIKNAQAKLEELVEAQQQTIKELSTPVIPVWSRVIMAPLLGSFDSVRMHDLSERLLEEVAYKKPRAVLLDLSGLAFVDTQVVSEILRLVTSVRLLGARTILSGIGPTVAQSLVRLGANLDGIATYATLEQALRNVVGEVGHARR
jgi:rsbT co-antagonist protein RsbR